MIKSSTVKIEIVTGDSRPMFKQIIDGIRMEIATGRLPQGCKLPSYRGLAMQLMINPNTVAKAYAELNAEGLVESRSGLGIFVAGTKQRISDEKRQQKLQIAIDYFINETISLNYSEKEMLNEIKINLKKIRHVKNIEEQDNE